MQTKHLTLIDQEREQLKKVVQLWGLSDERTLKQSQLVDRLIIEFMFNNCSSK